MKLTVDSKDGIMRAALWKGRELADLYVDRLDDPDVTGAVMRGRVIRLSPVTKPKGHRQAWFDIGDGVHAFMDHAEGLHEGEVRALRIKTVQESGKACTCELVEDPETGVETLGMVVSPPLPWARALADYTGKVGAVMVDDKKLAEALVGHGISQAKIKIEKGPIHPELDDNVDGLLKQRISLQGGGSLVIEKTEAFWSVDINGGERFNPLNVNLVAMRVLANRIKLCHMGGIVLVDALKMPLRADSAKMLNVLKRAVAEDPCGVQVFGVTNLGIVQIVRPRRGRSLYEVYGGAP